MSLPHSSARISGSGGTKRSAFLRLGKAQAQKAVATGAIERFWQFGGQIAALKPEAADRLDPDGTMEAYADMTGLPSGVMVDRKQALIARQQRAQAQAKQAALQQGVLILSAAF